MMTPPTTRKQHRSIPTARAALATLAGVSLVALGAVSCGDRGSDGPAGAAAQTGEGGSAGADAGGTIARAFTFGDVSFTVPEPWTPVAPSSAMRAAQFSVAPPEGAADQTPGIGAVFTSIGGGVDENLDRWAAQFVDPADREVTRDVQTINGRSFATFIGRGTFDEGRMMGSTGPKPGYMTLGFVVETQTDKPVFMKLTGPATTLEPHLEGAWREMVESVTIAR